MTSTTSTAVPQAGAGTWTAGVYKLTNARSGTAMDLSGDDNKTLIGYTPTGNNNQKFEFIPAGQGYLIRCLRPSTQGLALFLTIEGGPRDNVGIVASTYPVSWKVEQKGENIIISWPNTAFVFNLADGNAAVRTPIGLLTLKTGEGAQLWKFTRV